MYVILCYDVAKERTRKAMKVCRQYLCPVQRSVFEGNITPARLERLKAELAAVLEPEEDAVVIYRLDSARQAARDQIGKHSRVPDGFL